MEAVRLLKHVSSLEFSICCYEFLANLLRLVGGNSSIPLQSSGRLEIYIADEWGTICDSSGLFDQTSAEIACRELGFAGMNEYGPISELG